MPPPIREQIFDPKGTAQNASVLLNRGDVSNLPLNENIRIAKYGEIWVIEGWVQTATGVFQDVLGNGQIVTTIEHYSKSPAPSTVDNAFVAWGTDFQGNAERTVWDSHDGGVTWVRVSEGFISSSNLFPDMAQFENLLFITPGSSAIVYESTGGVGSVRTAGQTRPVALTAGTAADKSAVLVGTYRWKQALIDANGVVGPASPATAEVVYDEQNQPRISGFDTTGVGGLRVFRTTGTGNTFYKEVDFKAGSIPTTYTPNVTDDDLLREAAEIVNSGDPPPQAAYCEQHRDRVFWAASADGTNVPPIDTIFPSDLGNGESVPTSNSFRTGEPASNPITGMSGDYRGQLIVWTEQKVLRLQGDGPASWNLIATAASKGAVTHRAAVRVPAGARWQQIDGSLQESDIPTYAYIADDKTIRLFDGDNDIIISDTVSEFLEQLSYDARNQCIGIEYPDYGWVLWQIPTAFDYSTGFATEVTTIAWDYDHGVWHAPATPGYPQALAYARGSTQYSGGAFNRSIKNDGIIASEFNIQDPTQPATGAYEFFRGNNFNGSNRTATVVFNPTHLGAPGIQKLMRYAESWYAGIDGTQAVLKMNVYEGFAAAGASPFVALDHSNVGTGATAVQVVSSGQEELRNTSARYPIGMAFVLSWEYEGLLDWRLVGSVGGYTPNAPAPARARTP